MRHLILIFDSTHSCIYVLREHFRISAVRSAAPSFSCRCTVVPLCRLALCGRVESKGKRTKHGSIHFLELELSELSLAKNSILPVLVKFNRLVVFSGLESEVQNLPLK
jgi:hypothetical protein